MRRICKRCKETENIAPWAPSEYCHECQIKNRREKCLAKGRCPVCGRDMDNEFLRCNHCLEVAKKTRDWNSTANADNTKENKNDM